MTCSVHDPRSDRDPSRSTKPISSCFPLCIPSLYLFIFLSLILFGYIDHSTLPRLLVSQFPLARAVFDLNLLSLVSEISVLNPRSRSPQIPNRHLRSWAHQQEAPRSSTPPFRRRKRPSGRPARLRIWVWGRTCVTLSLWLSLSSWSPGRGWAGEGKTRRRAVERQESV
jgi:hypothetical protein